MLQVIVIRQFDRHFATSALKHLTGSLLVISLSYQWLVCNPGTVTLALCPLLLYCAKPFLLCLTGS